MAINGTLKTFVVEDNETIRENLVATLEELTAVRAVGFATSESAAVAWLLAHPDGWQVAIIDLFLEQGSGLGVMQACQQRAASQRVVVLTNYATDEVRRRCAALGVDAVFDKSREIDALIDYCNALTSAQRGSEAAPLESLNR